MKSLIVLLVLTFSVSVFAKEDVKQTQELLQLLIENAKDIKVVDPDNNTSKKNLAALLAEAFAASAKSDEKTQVLVSVWSQCENSTPQNLVGVSLKQCSFVINDADYKDTSSGLQGPEMESTVGFTFTTERVVAPKAKMKIKENTVYISRAG